MGADVALPWVMASSLSTRRASPECGEVVEESEDWKLSHTELSGYREELRPGRNHRRQRPVLLLDHDDQCLSSPDAIQQGSTLRRQESARNVHLLSPPIYAL